jgi:hypothetical protein
VERQRLANALTTAALDFLVMHEIEHILRNQIRFHGDLHQTFFLEAEVSEYKPLPDQIELQQLLELDADLSAAPESARQFTGAGKTILPVWRSWTNDNVEVVNLWLVMLALTLFLFDSWSRKTGNQAKSHPPPWIRITVIVVIVSKQLVDWQFAEGAEEAVTFALNALRDAAEIWSGLGLPEESASSVFNRRQLQDELDVYTQLLSEYGLLG